MTGPQEGLSSPDAAPEDRPRTPEPRIVTVAAVADNGVIGRDGDIPWRIPEDMKHFRAVTSGHTVVMGRLTYESIGRPLPHRTNIVVTRTPGWSTDGVTVVGSVEEALAKARAGGEGDVMVIGGAQLYAAVMGLADVQVITEVHQSPEGDTFYPVFDRAEWLETRREKHEGYDFVWLERR